MIKIIEKIIKIKSIVQKRHSTKTKLLCQIFLSQKNLAYKNSLKISLCLFNIVTYSELHIIFLM